MIVKRKAFAYITSRSQSPTAAPLLVFEHAGVPEAGIQVPAGTIEPGATPAAALREACEETGPAGLRPGSLLGVRRRDRHAVGLDVLHERHFFHPQYDGASPASWLHHECHASDGSRPIPFRCYCVRLPDGVPALIDGHGDLLPALLDRLARPAQHPPTIGDAS